MVICVTVLTILAYKVKHHNPQSVPPTKPVPALKTNTPAIKKYGGIDLNTANMGMTVTKDANGGVEVNIDPAMIERIKAQGIQSADPIIIRITPITAAEIRPLLGI